MWISGGKTALSRDNGKCKGPEAGASLEGLSETKMLPLLHSPKHYHLPASVWGSLTPRAHLQSHISPGPGGRQGVPLPESTTKRMPSMVTEVSAMLVERMHFRTPGGATSNTWGTVKRRPWHLVFVLPHPGSLHD